MRKLIYPLNRIILNNKQKIHLNNWRYLSFNNFLLKENDPKCFSESVIDDIANKLNLNDAERIEFRKKFIPKNSNLLKENIDLLISNGISTNTIFNNPWLLGKSKSSMSI